MDYKTDYKLTNLAFSLYYNPGVYTLLLGSGISKTANIKTGWEITRDLIKKLAVSMQQDPGSDVDDWYKKNFNEEPDYSKILEKIAKTPTERMNILKGYFKPTEEEKEQGLKVPTKAHKAIAEMVKMGYIKMILTTNFDRLLEKALEEVGVTPDVVKSEDDFKGAMPYVHSQCFIVKLHGDYKDTRIKNTEEELSHYSDITNKFLYEVLARFGLIIVGWSGKWDKALREAILKSQSRRFQTYWLAKGEIEEEAKEIINSRRAEVIKIENADEVFTHLLEKVKSLREFERKSPMSIEAEIAMIKRYISDPKNRIKLHDFVMERTEEAYKDLNSDKFNLREEVNEATFQKRMEDYEIVMIPLIKVLLPIAYYDKGENSYLLTKVINRIANSERRSSYYAWSNLQKYPALLLLYSLGMCALSSNNFNNLAAIMRKTKIKDEMGRNNLINRVNTTDVFYSDGTAQFIKRPNPNENRPANNYLFENIRPILKEYIPNDSEYEEIFDRFEYLFSLNYIDLNKPDLTNLAEDSNARGPIGRFGQKYNGFLARIYPDNSLFQYINGIKDSGSESELFKAGFFGSSIKRFVTIESAFRRWFLNETEGWI